MRKNALFRELASRNREPKRYISGLLDGDLEEARLRIAQRSRALDEEIRSVDWHRISREELVDLARYVTLRKRLEESLFEAEAARRRTGLEQLRWSRF